MQVAVVVHYGLDSLVTQLVLNRASATVVLSRILTRRTRRRGLSSLQSSARLGLVGELWLLRLLLLGLLQLRLLLAAATLNYFVEVVEHFGVDVVEVDFDLALALDLKKTNDAGCHLPDLFVDPHKISVDDVASLAVLDRHVVDLGEHLRDQEVVALVDAAEVDENQEDYVLKNSVPLA